MTEANETTKPAALAGRDSSELLYRPFAEADGRELALELKLRTGPDLHCSRCGTYVDGSGNWPCPGCGVRGYMSGSFKYAPNDPQWQEWAVNLAERYRQRRAI